MQLEAGYDVSGIKRRRRDLYSDGVRIFAMVVMDIQEKDKNRSQIDKTEHENGKSVKEKSKLKPSQKVKVNPGKWIWKEHRKPNPKT
ncbi:hypothetical protein Tco_0450513 [Tanacetum coccineum]